MIEIKLEDILHLYVGQEILMQGQKLPLCGVTETMIISDKRRCYSRKEPFQLILRKLSEMTEEEACEIDLNPKYKHYTFQQHEFIYLLKRGFDLFWLIDSGQALNKLTL